MTKEKIIENLKKMKSEKSLWLVVGYEIFLLIPCILRGVRSVKGSNSLEYYGYHYILFLPFLILGTLFFYWLVTYYLKGNNRIVLYAAVLLSWGYMMEVIILYSDSKKFLLGQIVILLGSYLCAIVAGLFCFYIKQFRYDFCSQIFAGISVFLYILLILFGVDPSGNLGEATTNLKIFSFSIQVTEILKVIYLLVLVTLLAKQNKRSKEEKRKRFIIALIFTAFNMAGMLALSEMGSLLIILLVFIAFILVYTEEIRWSITAIALGCFIILMGVLLGESMINSVDKNITAKEAMTSFYDENISYRCGYSGNKNIENIEVFRTTIYEFLDEKKDTDSRMIEKDDLSELIEKTSNETNTTTMQNAIEELYANDAEEIGYADLAKAVKNKKNKSIKIALCFIFSDQSAKESFMSTRDFNKLYMYYALNCTNNKLIKFYLPKYEKVRTRWYCCRHVDWDTKTTGYQNYLARSGIRKGGLFGMEDTNIDFVLNIPNSSSDMMLVSISALFGNIASILLLGIFYMLYREGKKVVLTTKQEYNSGMIFAMTFMIWIQAIFMTASNCGIFPISGMPIPFISNGGASKCVTMAMIGIMVMMSARQMDDFNQEEEEFNIVSATYIGYFFIRPVIEFMRYISSKSLGNIDAHTQEDDTDEGKE
jgi:cell division protein FtsW (lipid II flippase)